MEITLEKIELVKDRTGVSYAEAKAALEKADGSVVDAIIMIEEEIDIAPKTKAGDQASQLVEKIKELVRKGNISKIVIKKDGETVMNIPVNVGLLGIIFVPWVTLVSIVAALGTKCTIELLKDNGDVINLSGKAAETFDDMKNNCSVITDDIREKGEDVFAHAKEKAGTVINRIRRDVDEFDDDDYFNFDDFDDSVFDDYEEPVLSPGFFEKVGMAAEKAEEKAADAVETAAEKTAEIAEEIKDAAEPVIEKAAEKAEMAADAVEESAEAAMESTAETVEEAMTALDETLGSAENKFEEALEEIKARKNKFRFFE